MSRLLSAQPPFTMLVSNLEGSGDPSHGRNPVKVRTGITSQHTIEVPRGESTERVLDARTPGVHTHTGMLTWTVPGVHVGASATVTVSSTDFTYAATLLLNEFTVTSGDDFNVTTGTTYTGENIKSTLPNGIIAVWKTAGAGIGEGTILVPAHTPIAAGTLTFRWTTGGVAKSQTVNALGVFSGNGNPAGSSITLATGALTIDTTGSVPGVGSPITVDYTAAVTTTNVAANLATAIGGLPGFNATNLLNVITITGPNGPDGNEVRCSAVYRGSVQNFSIVPTNGFMSGAQPYLGPPVLLP